jgi:hypothetical protein
MPLTASAQGDRELCGIVRQISDGASLVQNLDATVQAISRRPLTEPAQVGFSAAKGDLARYLAKGKPGVSVKWSQASQRGPVKCGAYNAVLVTVDMNTVVIGPDASAGADADSTELEESMMRRIAGKATREDYIRLREYYVRAGDLEQARQMLEQAIQLK